MVALCLGEGWGWVGGRVRVSEGASRPRKKGRYQRTVRSHETQPFAAYIRHVVCTQTQQSTAARAVLLCQMLVDSLAFWML